MKGNQAGVDPKGKSRSASPGGVPGASKRTIGPETHKAGKMKPGGRKLRSKG